MLATFYLLPVPARKCAKNSRSAFSTSGHANEPTTDLLTERADMKTEVRKQKGSIIRLVTVRKELPATA